MKLGMLTACLPAWPLARIAQWAAGAGYEALEVAVWPSTGGRDFEAAHLPVAHFGSRHRDETLALFEKYGLQLSAFAYYENNLHPDVAHRDEIATHLRHAVDAAQLLGVAYVGTFVGRAHDKALA